MGVGVEAEQLVQSPADGLQGLADVGRGAAELHFLAQGGDAGVELLHPRPELQHLLLHRALEVAELGGQLAECRPVTRQLVAQGRVELQHALHTGIELLELAFELPGLLQGQRRRLGRGRLRRWWVAHGLAGAALGREAGLELLLLALKRLELVEHQAAAHAFVGVVGLLKTALRALHGSHSG
ncbi:MAG TPA: hypothetical protein PLY66_03575 [Acidobacteriota bacterium]|nr:hypothetical protein [Acidobacteriota bacterium]